MMFCLIWHRDYLMRFPRCVLLLFYFWIYLKSVLFGFGVFPFPTNFQIPLISLRCVNRSHTGFISCKLSEVKVDGLFSCCLILQAVEACRDLFILMGAFRSVLNSSVSSLWDLNLWLSYVYYGIGPFIRCNSGSNFRMCNFTKIF